MGKPPYKFHESEIPKITEIRCFAGNDPIKEIMDVLVLTHISGEDLPPGMLAY